MLVEIQIVLLERNSVEETAGEPWRAERHTVLLVHTLKFPDELSAFEEIEIELVQLSGSSELWSWKSCERMKVETINGK